MNVFHRASPEFIEFVDRDLPMLRLVDESHFVAQRDLAARLQAYAIEAYDRGMQLSEKDFRVDLFDARGVENDDAAKKRLRLALLHALARCLREELPK